MIRRGDIVLLSFPFTNLRSSKVRPALVISDDSYNKQAKDAVFIFITSKEHKSTYDLRIEKKAKSFDSTGLKSSSTIRIAKIMCLDKKLVRRRLGNADDRIMKRVGSALKCLLDL